MPSVQTSIDIENSGGSIQLDTKGHVIVDLSIRGDAAADYAVDVKSRDGSWVQDVTAGYTGSADYDDVLERGAKYVRVRCTSGTATAGDSATISLFAGD